MVWLVLLALFAGIFGMTSVFLDVWRSWREKKRSIATAIAITCIVSGFPTAFAAGYFEKTGPSLLLQSLQMAGIVLMFGAGIFGAIGLVWDRRIAKRRLHTRE